LDRDQGYCRRAAYYATAKTKDSTLQRVRASNSLLRIAATQKGESLSPFAIIILAGTICGVLDIISATALFLSKGGTFVRLLQFIASGALGESSFRGGKKTAALGLFFHFVIAFAAAAIYYAASRNFLLLIAQPVLCGILYGVLIHLFMTFITIPLSRAPKRKFSASSFLSQLAVHMFVVGLSISLTIARFS
jgi:hypothetical protein